MVFAVVAVAVIGRSVSNKLLELVTGTTFTGISRGTNLPAYSFPQTNPNSYQ